MNYSKIAVRYAKALFLAAQEEQKLEAVFQDVLAIQEIVRINEDFQFFLKTPVFNPSEKKDIVVKTFQPHIDHLTLRFLVLLTEHRRENMLLDMIRNFISLYYLHHQMINATLITPSAIDEQFVQQIKVKLESALSKKIILQNKIKEDLIGGFILQIEDKEYDASIKSQLDKIKRNLENTSMIK